MLSLRSGRTWVTTPSDHFPPVTFSVYVIYSDHGYLLSPCGVLGVSEVASSSLISVLPLLVRLPLNLS